MEEIRFNCPHCGQHFEAEQGMGGVRLKCANCAKEIVVPDEKPHETTTEPFLSKAAVESTSVPDSVLEPVYGGAVPPVLTANGAKKKGNYFVRHWRGDLSLGVSYWANGLIAGLVIGIMVAAIAALVEPLGLRVVAGLLIAGYVFGMIVWIWWLVGLWQSAGKHAGRGGRSVWATLARVGVICGCISGVGSIATNYGPQVFEFSRILIGDSGTPPYEVRVLSGSEVEFRGGLRAGSAYELEHILKAVPHAKVLRLSSPGGRMVEAEKMARLVRTRNMNTYTPDFCMSAATLVFLAGKDRAVGENARLGFHVGHLPGETIEQKRNADEKLRKILKAAGVSEGFIDQVVRTPNTEMWYPSVEELRRANVVTSTGYAPTRALASQILTQVLTLVEGTPRADSTPQPTGNEELDRLAVLLKRQTDGWGRFFQELTAELDNTGTPDVFSLQTLKYSENLQSGLQCISKRRRVLEGYQARGERECDLYEQETAGILASAVTTEGRQFASGLQAGYTRSRARMREFFSLRMNAEVAEGRFLRFMIENFQDYQVGAKTISFHTKSNEAQYKVLGKAITDSWNAADAFQQKMLAAANSAAKDLRRAAQ